MKHEEIEKFLNERYHMTSEEVERIHGSDWTGLISDLEAEGLHDPGTYGEQTEMESRINDFMVKFDPYTRKRKKYLRMGL